MLLNVRTVALVLVLACAACRPGGHAADHAATGPSSVPGKGAPRSLQAKDAPKGQRATFLELQWDRPGVWRSVTRSYPGGASETVLIAHDPYGDRLIARASGGYSLWRGTIDCARGTSRFDRGAVISAMGGAKPVRGLYAPLSQGEVHAYCAASDGPSGAPAAVQDLASYGGVRLRYDPALAGSRPHP